MNRAQTMDRRLFNSRAPSLGWVTRESAKWRDVQNRKLMALDNEPSSSPSSSSPSSQSVHSSHQRQLESGRAPRRWRRSLHSPPHFRCRMYPGGWRTFALWKGLSSSWKESVKSLITLGSGKVRNLALLRVLAQICIFDFYLPTILIPHYLHIRSGYRLGQKNRRRSRNL